jgi:hypothetical protein
LYVFNAKLQREAFSDGDVMIHDTQTQTIHILNPTSVAILDLLLGNEPAEALALFLARFAEAGAQRAELEADFAATAEALQEKQILLAS